MPKIKEVVTEPNRPVLINFQNGKIQPGEETSLDAALFKEKGSNKKLIGVSNGDMLYTGEVADFNSFLVVQTPDSKSLQLIQVDTSVVAPLLENKAPTTATTPVKGHSLAELRKEFGSKKAKRYTEQQERLTTNIENVKQTLEMTVADVTISEIPTTMNGDGDSLYKPKINRDASSKDQVYQLQDLVPQEVLDTLEEKVIEILESDDFKEFELLPTVEKLMLDLRASQPERTVVEKCKILLYVHYLVKFMITPLKNMTKKFISCDCSSEVDKHIKNNYMVNNTRPITMKDKGLCYTIVLLMLAMDHELDLEMISKDIKTGIKKMQEFARNLGFSGSSKNKNSISLKLPVPPPVMPNLKRKKN
ncbi:unnamed protein product [Ceutorhynchus assimilis]|uniref:DNA-directed RNA polymerase I subunit RPA49 n=1 Tax=Ceutorhynchus assimilis TaxID=467358 RepID=A0A9N9MCL6_9CUCU|nr:unnamed protein product [Ceutorhynchus assimilis]